MPNARQGLKKSLPRRVLNEKAKAKRKRSWERTQIRKAKRREAQRKAWEHNQQLRALGQLTPWERANEKASIV